MKHLYALLCFFTLVYMCPAQPNADLLPVKIDYKWGFINKAGQTIIEPTYDYTENFVCGLAKVKLKGAYGVIDQSGKVVIGLENSDLNIYCPNYIVFKKDTSWGLADHTGNVIIPNNYQRIEFLGKNTFMTKKGGLWGLYQVSSSKIIEPAYQTISVTGKGFYLLKRDQKTGLADSSLNVALQADYNDIQVVSPTIIMYKQKEFWGIATATGDIISNAEYMSYKKYGNDFVGVKTKKGGWLIYSSASKKILPTEEQESFTILDKNLVMLNKAHKHGVVDASGKVILEQNYSNIHLNESMLLVEQAGKWGLADLSGKFIIETVHTKLFPFKKNIAVFEAPTGKGIINNKGKIIAQPIYTNIDLGNGTAKGTKANGSIENIKLEVPPKGTKPVVSDASAHGHAWLKGPNKKWGLLGHDTILAPFKYDEIIEVDGFTSIMVMKMDYRTNQKMYGYMNANKIVDLASHKIGLINKVTGKVMIQPTLWNVRLEDFKTDNNARVVAEGGQQGLMDKSGKIVSEIVINKDKKQLRYKLDYIGKFNSKVARFCTGCNVNYQGDWENAKVDGGKWGYIRQDGSILLEPQYEEASDMYNARAIVKLKGMYGMINDLGNFVLKPEYQNLAFISESGNKFLKMEIKKERYGLINLDGRALTAIKYDKIFPFREGMAKVMINGKYGFIDETDQLVIEAKYDNAQDFSDGYAAILVGRKWGYIDIKGAQKILPTYVQVGSFKNGLAPIVKDGKTGYINLDEKMIINPIYLKGTEFNNNIAIVTTDLNKQGLLDPAGAIILDGKYDEIKPMGNPRFYKVRQGAEWQLFDKETKIVSKKSFSDIGEMYEGMAWVRKDNVFNYIDSTGKIAISKKFTAASNFVNGLAKVQSEGKYGYINPRGFVVINYYFPNCTDFGNERAFVEGPNKLYGIIDRNGKNITYDKFIAPKPYSNGFGLVSTANKEYYFVDLEGNNAFGTQLFEMAYPFDANVARVKVKKWGLVNTSGFHSLDYKYDYMSEITNNQAIVSLQTSSGIMDLEGRILAEPVFDSFTYMGDGVFRLEKWDAVGYFSIDKNWLWPLKK